MEDSQHLSYILAGIKYYKEGVSEWYVAEFWVWGWQQ